MSAIVPRFLIRQQPWYDPFVSDIRWLDPTEDRAWRGLRRIDSVVVAAIVSDLLAESGLSDADYEVLSNLTDAPDHRLRAGDLARKIRWSTSRLAHQVTRMEQRGLLRRLARDDDARGSDLQLTPRGRKAIVDAAPQHVASVRRHLYDHLSEQQVRQLAAITTTLLAAHDLTLDEREPPWV